MADLDFVRFSKSYFVRAYLATVVALMLSGPIPKSMDYQGLILVFFELIQSIVVYPYILLVNYFLNYFFYGPKLRTKSKSLVFWLTVVATAIYLLMILSTAASQKPGALVVLEISVFALLIQKLRISTKEKVKSSEVYMAPFVIALAISALAYLTFEGFLMNSSQKQTFMPVTLLASFAVFVFSYSKRQIGLFLSWSIASSLSVCVLVAGFMLQSENALIVFAWPTNESSIFGSWPSTGSIVSLTVFALTYGIIDAKFPGKKAKRSH